MDKILQKGWQNIDRSYLWVTKLWVIFSFHFCLPIFLIYYNGVFGMNFKNK